MFNLYVQTSDSNHVIENIENLNENEILSIDQLNKIIENENNFIFIVNKENYNRFSEFDTIGDDHRCTIVCIDDLNIENYHDKKLQNVYLFVESEEKLFSNFEKIYKNVSGFIEFKFKELKHYDEKLLTHELKKIADIVAKLEKDGSNLIVKQLNGYRIQKKFNQFGETDFFVGLDGNVYRHPSFYYQQNKKGIVCKIEDFTKTDDTYYQISQPHLICVMCETFYCDRDIYHNKKYTNEFKVPCKNSCKMSTLLTNISKYMFNQNIQDIFEEKNLDVIKDYNSFDLYRNFINNSCICNKIKKIDFSNREINKKANKI